MIFGNTYLWRTLEGRTNTYLLPFHTNWTESEAREKSKMLILIIIIFWVFSSCPITRKTAFNYAILVLNWISYKMAWFDVFVFLVDLDLMLTDKILIWLLIGKTLFELRQVMGYGLKNWAFIIFSYFKFFVNLSKI